MYKRFKFVKEFKDNGDVIPVGSELAILNERVYFNGGQIMPGLHDLFYNLIMEEINKPNYLKEVAIPYNKV